MNNRQIKFRAWDKLEKRYTYPDKGYQGHFVLDLNGKFYNLQNGSGGDDYVVQQYTGFKSYNGKDIWEGDIIEFETTNKKYRGLIGYHIGAFIILGNSLDEEKTITHIWLKDVYKDIFNLKVKVIGSSLENVELLDILLPQKSEEHIKGVSEILAKEGKNWVEYQLEKTKKLLEEDNDNAIYKEQLEINLMALEKALKSFE